MKYFLLLLSLLSFASASFGQTAVTPIPTSGKVGLVNPVLFADEKAGAGITRLKTALKTVNDEVTPLRNKLQADTNRLRAMAAEIEKLRGTQGTPISTIQAKVIEAQELETSIKRGDEDLKLRFDKRYSEVVAPVYDQIFLAMNEYAKQKGYAIILNGPKLEQDDILIGFDSRYDVTADFIIFFNARPAAR